MTVLVLATILNAVMVDAASKDTVGMTVTAAGCLQLLLAVFSLAWWITGMAWHAAADNAGCDQHTMRMMLAAIILPVLLCVAGCFAGCMLGLLKLKASGGPEGLFTAAAPLMEARAMAHLEKAAVSRMEATVKAHVGAAAAASPQAVAVTADSQGGDAAAIPQAAVA
jgi:hypothetical protein